MGRRNLLIASGLIGGIFVLVIGIVIFVLPAVNIFIDDFFGIATFDNSTPEATAVSIARLNYGEWGFNSATIKSVHLTSDGKYWIVEIYNSVYKDGFDVITIDAGTWGSKIDDGEWKSLDELKACYIAEIQSDNVSKPYKITMFGKEIWKVPVGVYSQENGWLGQIEHVYVDVATGKSQNTWDEFNEAAGTDSWLTLNQVDDTLNKIQKEMTGFVGVPFRDALRDLYSE